MSEMFINEIITDLSSKIPDEYLKVIQARLIKHCDNYDIQPRETRITQVQRLLGHVNVNTTLIYCKTTDEEVKNSHKKYL